MSDKVTDNRPAFFLVDDAVVENYELTPYEGWVYIVILKHANRKTKEAFPGIARLARLAKMSKMQVMRAISTLEEKKLIRVERDERPLKGEKRQRSVNHYFILPVAGSNQQQLGVVTGSEYPSNGELLGVVTGSDKNQYSSKQEEKNQPKAKPKSKSAEEVFRNDWNDIAPLGNALLAAFGNDFVPAANQAPSALLPYLEVAQELTSAGASLDEIPHLSKYIAARARREEWSKYGVKTFARYYTDFLKTRRDKIINDDPSMDLSIPQVVVPKLLEREEAS